MKDIRICGLETIPEVKKGDDLARMISDACRREGFDLAPGDVVLITSKIVSKAEGRVVNLSEVVPGRKARAVAKATGKDPVEVEVILREAEHIRGVIPVKKIAERFPEIFDNIARDKDSVSRVLSEVPAMLLTTKEGLTSSDAGLDYSNNPAGTCTLLPADPNGSADSIRRGLADLCGGEVAVVITDTEVTFTHLYGSQDIAIGYSGIRPVARAFGSEDRYRRAKFGGADVIVDELAGASALLMGQTSEGIPVVIVKGLRYDRDNMPAPKSGDEILSKGILWSLLATAKLRLARLLEPFV